MAFKYCKGSFKILNVPSALASKELVLQTVLRLDWKLESFSTKNLMQPNPTKLDAPLLLESVDFLSSGIVGYCANHLQV